MGENTIYCRFEMYLKVFFALIIWRLDKKKLDRPINFSIVIEIGLFRPTIWESLNIFEAIFLAILHSLCLNIDLQPRCLRHGFIYETDIYIYIRHNSKSKT